MLINLKKSVSIFHQIHKNYGEVIFGKYGVKLRICILINIYHLIPRSLMKSHCTPRANDLTDGSTQRSVAVNEGIFAKNVMSIVKKNDVRNIGR